MGRKVMESWDLQAYGIRMKGASVDTRVTKCYPLVLGDCLKEEE
jgi:hypothetical protein